VRPTDKETPERLVLMDMTQSPEVCTVRGPHCNEQRLLISSSDRVNSHKYRCGGKPSAGKFNEIVQSRSSKISKDDLRLDGDDRPQE
jgi:hypothetical protein